MMIDHRIASIESQPDPATLSTLLAGLEPCVEAVVQHYQGSRVAPENLRPVGYLGLLTAAARFDPRAIPFEQVAGRFIAAEIRAYLRDGGDPTPGPRWLDELDGRLQRAVAHLFRRLDRPPTLAEIAREVNIAEPGILEILRARRAVGVSSRTDGADAPIRREWIVHHHYVSFRLPIEDKIRVAEAVERLSAIQRKVILFLFEVDRTQTEVARRLLVSQRHVSPRHDPLVRLRDMLGPPRVLGPPRPVCVLY